MKFKKLLSQAIIFFVCASLFPVSYLVNAQIGTFSNPGQYDIWKVVSGVVTPVSDRDVSITNLNVNSLSAVTLVISGVVSGNLNMNGNDINNVGVINMAGDLTIYEPTNDANPEIRIGSADAEEVHLKATYDSGSQILDYFNISTDSTGEGDISLNPASTFVGINKTAPIVALDVIGAINASTTVTANSATLTGGTNTFNITNGTAIFDVAAGSTANIDANITVSNAFTVGTTNGGTLDFTAASKTLNVEDTATVDQDYTLDASPTWASVHYNDNTTAAYDLIIDSDSNVTVLDADRTLIFDVNNADRNIDLKGDLTVNNSFVVGTTNGGTLDFTAASKTLNVEDTSTVNQDLTTDADVVFNSVTVADGQTVGATTSKWLFDDTSSDISTTAEVGIGTTDPDAHLHVVDGAASSRIISDGALDSYFTLSNSDVIKWTIGNDFSESGDFTIQNTDFVNPASAQFIIDSSTNDILLQSGASATGRVGIGTNDLDGTPAIGKLTVKGSTNDGSTNIFVGRDSDEVNMATLDTNGLLTTEGRIVSMNRLDAYNGAMRMTNSTLNSLTTYWNYMSSGTNTDSLGFFNHSIADAGTNTAFIYDTTNALTGTTKISSWKNAGVEKAYIDNAGSGNFIGLKTSGFLDLEVQSVTTATYSSSSANATIYHIAYTDTDAHTFTLSTADCTDDRIIIINDGDGNANANNITIDTEGSEKINGADTIGIIADDGSWSFYCASSNWYTF